MTREHTFSAEGEEAFSDIKTMLGGFSPPDDISRVEVTFTYAESQTDESADEAALSASEPSPSKPPLPHMNRDTKGHEVLTLLVSGDSYLTNEEIEERIGAEAPVGSTTSRLHRKKEVLAARRAQDGTSRYKYTANALGERLIDEIGEYSSD